MWRYVVRPAALAVAALLVRGFLAAQTPGSLMAAAQARLAARDLDGAGMLLHQVIDTASPASPGERAAAWMWLGVVGFYGADDSAASDAFRHALALDPAINGDGLEQLDPAIAGLFTTVRAELPSCDAGALCAESVVDERPRLVWAPELTYPQALRSARVQGRVLLQAIVDTTGRAVATSIRVLQTPDPGFQPVVMRYALLARFEPGRVRGRPVRTLVNIPIDFRLSGVRVGDDLPPRPAASPTAPVHSCVPRCEQGLRSPTLVHLSPLQHQLQDHPESFGLGPQGARGYLVVRGIVDETGRMESGSLRVVASTSAIAAQALEGALQAAEFRPGELDGRPVRVEVEIRYECRREGTNLISCNIQGP